MTDTLIVADPYGTIGIVNQAIMVHDKFTQDAVSRGRLLPKRW